MRTMYDYICPICEIKFKTKHKTSKHCSIKCARKARTDLSGPEHGRRASENLLKYYQTDIYKDKKESIYKKISETNKVRLSEIELQDLEKMLDEKYVRDLNIMIGHVCKDKSKSLKAIKNAFTDYPYLKEKHKETLYALPSHIQKYNINTWVIIKQYIKSGDKKTLKEVYNIGEKTYYRIRAKYKIDEQYPFFDNSETEIERFVRLYLEELKVGYRREYRINNNKWVIDFLVGNLAIEVNGDYWHANNRMYIIEELDTVQLKNLNNDIEKRNWLIENGYNVLIIWGIDIYNNQERIKKMIKKYVKQDNIKGICRTSFED